MKQHKHNHHESDIADRLMQAAHQLWHQLEVAVQHPLSGDNPTFLLVVGAVSVFLLLGVRGTLSGISSGASAVITPSKRGTFMTVENMALKLALTGVALAVIGFAFFGGQTIGAHESNKIQGASASVVSGPQP